MMEPDVRIKTNRQGFCRLHYGKMLRASKKLPVALMLESHLDEVAKTVRVGKLFPAKGSKDSADNVEAMTKDCYVCSRLDASFGKVLDNAVYMWLSDDGNRIPVWFEAPFKIGNVSGRMERVKGTRYPLKTTE